jgi:20S proteasome alpha/beta subunit
MSPNRQVCSVLALYGGVCSYVAGVFYLAGNYFEYVAMAIGSRSQTSRTYLEKEFESHGFTGQSLEELIKHALRALAASLSGNTIYNKYKYKYRYRYSLLRYVLIR